MRWDFPPVAAERGLPSDVSQEAAEEHTRDISRFPNEFYGASWITWSEIQSVNWDEAIENRVIERRQDQTFGTAYWRFQFLRNHANIITGGEEALRPGQRWAVGEMTYEVVAMRRRDTLEREWELLFNWMEALAKRRGDPSHIRMVVWFDG